ncbi:TPM domain-containing protein [Sphingomonas sp. HF-S4]|uniref:TPM domain-containing protein n=1 Tax=Sphingomonas agrestis TaxID=3080540 RepID=A0ABU3YB81_9SPHN|nr:TPM domain-containing protein [Sphingomonas sp. HF-S4]MDV3458661.1 TPM domain-containing protein [Sphingomonas sp. HF-S4]
MMRILRLLLALLLFAPLAVHAQTFPKRDREPVVDAANLLDAAQKAQITALAEEINTATTRQFVVATIPDLQGYDIADYGYRLGRAWGIGQKDANNGILLIVAPNERKVRIEVGYGLEPIMTDAMSSSIIQDTILPRFRANDMPGGIVAGAQAIGEQMKLPLEAAEARAKAQADKATTATRQNRRSSGGGFPWGLVFWGIILVFVIIPMFARGRGRKYRRGPWGDRRYSRGGDGGALPIILWSIANEISRGSHGGGSSGWGGGGGGWGGGGGGGGFSGGGGSFGGGGASGSW